MTRRMTVSQYNNYIRKLQREQKQAFDKFNREVRSHNQKVKRSIDNYNREVRSYNQRVKSNRQRLRNELNKMNRSSTVTTRYTVYQSSVVSLNSHYESLDKRSEYGGLNERYNHFVDLSEKEAANSVEVLNALVDSDQTAMTIDLQKTAMYQQINFYDNFSSPESSILYSK